MLTRGPRVPQEYTFCSDWGPDVVKVLVGFSGANPHLQQKAVEEWMEDDMETHNTLTYNSGASRGASTKASRLLPHRTWLPKPPGMSM
jgi:hypothetical protein